MDILLLGPLRAATSQIDKIINAFLVFVTPFFSGGSDNYFVQISNVILNNEYLLISVSLLLIGFVIGIIKRIISI